MDSDFVLHVWLIKGGADGAMFLEDVLSMLNRILDRAGFKVVSASPAPSPSGGRVDVSERVSGQGSPNVLIAELGIHRAQRIPDRQTGRIETSLVGVELASSLDSPASGRPDGPILRTYSYQAGYSFNHVSNQRLPLLSVLEGQR